MHLAFCPYCTSRCGNAQAFVEGQSFLLAATSLMTAHGMQTGPAISPTIHLRRMMLPRSPTMT